MAVSYGPNVFFDTVVAAVYNEMVLLKADIISNSHSPAIAEVYNSHLGDGNWSFNAVTVGLSEVEMELTTQAATPVGRGIMYHFHVDIRVLIGYMESTYPDEQKTRQLAQSVVNWMQEHFNIDDATYGAAFQLSTRPSSVDIRAQFDDTGTIGALIQFAVRSDQGYEAK